jgi:queuine/archaeosine tRNA-ribosyltransferase
MYYQVLMRRIRGAIADGTLTTLAKEESERCPPLNGRRA